MGSNGWGTIVAMVRWAFAAVGVLLATAAPAAAATTRYVSTTGTGTACTQAAPCDLVFGWLGATVGGDTVSIAPGTYGSPAAPIQAPLADAPGKVLHISGGATGPDRPVIWSKGAIKLYQAGSTIADVDSRSTEGFGLDLVNASADRIVATVAASNNNDACGVGPGATLTNSLCIGANPNDYSAVSSIGAGATIRNVTAFGPAYGLYAVADTVTIGNTAMEGTAQADLTVAPGATGTVGASAYDVLSGTVTAAGGNVDPGAVPLFRGAGDFRQASGSPTLNAGSAAQAAAGKTLDLNGNVRTLGASIDIGAYEDVPLPPAVGAPAATVNSASTATVTSTLDTLGGATSYRLEYGGGDFAQSTPLVRVNGSTAGASPLSYELTGLTGYTTYQYHVVATSDGGVTTSPTQTFKTPAAPPAAATGDATGVAQTSAQIAATVDTKGPAGTAHFVVTPAGGAAANTPDQILTEAHGDRGVTATLTGLAANTTYTYRVVLTTEAGTAEGESKTFKTEAVPAQATPSPSPSPSPSPTPKPAGPSGPTLSLNLNLRKGQTAGQLLLDRRTITLFIRCGNVACTATATGVVRSGKKILGRLAAPRKPVSLGANRPGSIKVISSKPLRDKVRAYLRRYPKRKVVMVLSAIFVGADGTRVTRSETIRLRRLERDRR